MAVSQRSSGFQRLHRVQRFAGLGNGNDQLVRIGNHAAVSVFAGDFDIGRDFGDGFQPIFGGQRGVIGRAAGKDFDAADAFKHAFGVFAEVFGDEAAVEENLRRVCNRARLLMDFLLHKVAVRSQFQRGEREFGYLDFAFGRQAVFIGQPFDAV